MIARLRYALILHAIGLSAPLVAATAYFAVGIIFHSPCSREVCVPLPLWLLMLAILLFAGPLWWTASSARRAAVLKQRQLAWLISVNVYLVVTAAFLGSIWQEPAQYLGFSGAPVLLAAFLVLPALVSTAFCAERIWSLRTPLK